MADYRRLASRIALAIGVALLAALNLAPILWGVLASFKTDTQIVTNDMLVAPTVNNYREVLSGSYTTGLVNSVWYGLAAVAIALAAGSLAAFSLDRFRYRGRSLMFLMIVASIPLAIGASVLLIPNFLFFGHLGLTNKWFTLPLLYSVYALPMAVWMIKGGMEAVPHELDEAAYIDGASSFTVFRRIVVPLCKPAIGAAGLLVFIHAWNEFVAGTVMVDAPALKPVQPLVYSYIGYYGRQWGPLTAAAILTILPVLIIYFLFGRLLISGLMRGAVKG